LLLPEPRGLKLNLMKILVTGGNGFIGSHVVDNLLLKNHEVTVFDRFKKVPPRWKNVNQYTADIKDAESLFDAVAKHDCVIHLAGLLGTAESVSTPKESVDVNIVGALNVYNAVKRYKKPAVTITVGNYTWNNTYAITKYTAERFALMYNREFDTKIAIVRGLNVYGQRQKHAPVKKVIPNFILNALKNKPIAIYGDGEQLLDLIYVKDTAEIIVRALLVNHNLYNTVVEAGSGETVSVNELAGLIIKLANSKSQVQHLPMRSGEPLRSITLGDPSTLQPLAFRTQDFTPLEKGLKRTIAWYKKEYLPRLDSETPSIQTRRPKTKRSSARKRS